MSQQSRLQPRAAALSAPGDTLSRERATSCPRLRRGGEVTGTPSRNSTERGSRSARSLPGELTALGPAAARGRARSGCRAVTCGRASPLRMQTEAAPPRSVPRAAPARQRPGVRGQSGTPRAPPRARQRGLGHLCWVGGSRQVPGGDGRCGCRHGARWDKSGKNAQGKALESLGPRGGGMSHCRGHPCG